MTSLHKPGLRRRLGLNSYCGDGVLNGPEECDLGQGNTADDGDVSGCSSYCTRPHYCGDGVLDAPTEQCDYGAANGTLGVRCDTNCRVIGS